jgi:hypothetical protein
MTSQGRKKQVTPRPRFPWLRSGQAGQAGGRFQVSGKKQEGKKESSEAGTLKRDVRNPRHSFWYSFMKLRRGML